MKVAYRLIIIFLICLTGFQTDLKANQDGFQNPNDMIMKDNYITKNQSFIESNRSPFSDPAANEEPPILFAPPEGGDPIGGLPVEDGLLLFPLFLAVYILYLSYKNKSRKEIL